MDDRQNRKSDHLLPADSQQRAVARDLYDAICELPIISPHGHTDPAWFAEDRPFADPASLFLTPDHYVLRMLRSQGIDYDRLGVPRKDGTKVGSGPDAWRLLCENWHLFLGTPSRLWLEHSLRQYFGITEPLSAETAEASYATIAGRLNDADMRPRAILENCKVEVIATTEFALDPLTHHQRLAADGLIGRIRTTYRPDDVTDPDAPAFRANLRTLAELTGEDTAQWSGLIAAHRKRRAVFRQFGATATDHGVPTAFTADLPEIHKQALLDRVLSGPASAEDAELFRGQMMTEMAALSVEDGMVMQLHAGSRRNLDPMLMAERGANLGADIPRPTNYVDALAPLLGRFGNADGFRLILFTLDETVYARELAPLAGYWSALRLGPPWWFHDSPNGIRRFFDSVVETAGFFNLAGFNDDTRALLSIPARHDVWRREVARFLSGLVGEHRLGQADAREIAAFLAYGAAKDAYRL
jgi:glucuronate isomerase